MKNSWMLLTLMLAVPVSSCPKGSEPYQGVCVDMPQPQDNAPETKPSDEKAPQNPQAEWETGVVIASNPASCAATNNCSDQVTIDAAKQGKKAAGIKN